MSIVKFLPSYWLVQASKTSLRGGAGPLEAWLVIVVWTLVLSFLGVRVYERDTNGSRSP